MTDVSDQTLLGEKTWKDLKSEVCQSDDYKTKEWFLNLSKDNKELIEALREIQLKTGISEPMSPQNNPKLAAFISKRIEDLFPETNFYFFKMFKSDAQRNEEEKDQLRCLIEDNIRSERFYIDSGLLEPVHL